MRNLLHALFVAIWFALGVVTPSSYAATVGQGKDPAFTEMASFRAHVVDLLKDDWRLWDVQADWTSPSTIEISLRSDHQIPHRYDVKGLFGRVRIMNSDEVDKAIEDAIESAVFRPHSRHLLAGVFPVIQSKTYLAKWQASHRDQPDSANLVSEPLSADAVILFQSGLGDFTYALISNYDLEGVSRKQLWRMALTNLNGLYENIEIVAGKDGLSFLGTPQYSGGYILHGSNLLLTDAFWEKVQQASGWRISGSPNREHGTLCRQAATGCAGKTHHKDAGMATDHIRTAGFDIGLRASKRQNRSRCRVGVAWR